MHVLHVAQATTEGVARAIADLVGLQVAGGIDVSVACPADGWLASTVAASGAQVVTWAATRSPGPSSLAEARSLRAIVRRLAPDVLHLHSSKAGLAGRLAIRGRIPTVYQPHAWSFLAVTGVMGRAALSWERQAARWTDRFICVSESERRSAIDHGIKLAAKTTVIANGVDLARYPVRGRDEARKELELDESLLVVCVGRLSEQKGQDVLLTAWPLVREYFGDARLVLVGDGPWRADLEARNVEATTFVGNSTDPRGWYTAANVVVVPSRWEGMAFVPLEASASRRSVVITEVAGARESVPTGAGEVVAIDDPIALAAAVVARLIDPAMADREGEVGRAHVSAHHTTDVASAAVLAVYAEVLAARVQTAR